MATLVRWSTAPWAPLRELATMQTEVSRLMNGLFDGNGRATQAWVPTVDAWETEAELVYAFDLPGVGQDQISVEAEDGMLTVVAERARNSELEEEHFQRIERRYGTFTRTVGLPQGVNEEAITATYVDGVLEVHVPKPARSLPKKVAIGIEGEPRTVEPKTSVV